MTEPVCARAGCPKPIARRPNEQRSKWLTRKFCSRECMYAVAGERFGPWREKQRTTWYRARFTHKGDMFVYRWPPPGPCWESGCRADGAAIVVAYVRTAGQIERHWPGAFDISMTRCERPEFHDRFPMPHWWDDEAQRVEGAP